MGQRATYSCTALVGSNKRGVVKPDADGYYSVVLGALNVYNSAGAYYPLESAKELFAESGSLMRRISNGALRGEYGHPKFEPGMSKRDFIGRVMNIHEENVSHHIRAVTLDFDNVKDKNGRAVIAVIGEIKPAGPRGAELKASLENGHENVCFSIRSLTDDVLDNRGIVMKHLRQIITWDYVNEPGISVANKFSFPSMEGLQDVSFTISHLNAVREHQRELGVSMESSNQVSVESVIQAFGWDKPIVASKTPPSAKW